MVWYLFWWAVACELPVYGWVFGWSRFAFHLGFHWVSVFVFVAVLFHESFVLYVNFPSWAPLVIAIL